MSLFPWWGFALLAADGTLITLDILQRNGLLEDSRFLVTYERGFAEWFQYSKGLALTASLLVYARSRASAAALVLAIVLGWIVLDDAFMLHEQAGARLAGVIPALAWLPLRPQDLGELMALGAVGLCVASALLVLWRQGSERERPILVAGALGLTALGFFGVGLDVAHVTALVPREHWLRAALGVIEDGGEMVALTGMAVALYLAQLDSPRRLSRPFGPPAASWGSREPAE